MKTDNDEVQEGEDEANRLGRARLIEELDNCERAIRQERERDMNSNDDMKVFQRQFQESIEGEKRAIEMLEQSRIISENARRALRIARWYNAAGLVLFVGAVIIAILSRSH